MGNSQIRKSGTFAGWNIIKWNPGPKGETTLVDKTGRWHLIIWNPYGSAAEIRRTLADQRRIEDRRGERHFVSWDTGAVTDAAYRGGTKGYEAIVRETIQWANKFIRRGRLPLRSEIERGNEMPPKGAKRHWDWESRFGRTRRAANPTKDEEYYKGIMVGGKRMRRKDPVKPITRGCAENLRKGHWKAFVGKIVTEDINQPGTDLIITVEGKKVTEYDAAVMVSFGIECIPTTEGRVCTPNNGYAETPSQPRGVKEALTFLNRKRERIGQRPLDPIASGWKPEDIITEARRLGWKSKANPKKKAPRKISEPARLIRLCEKRWEHYSSRKSKKRLKEVFEHLEKMKTSRSKKVVATRSKCLRLANKEAKKLKMK